jgi:malonate-semialdehyde dehydrogenase (acetylating) / methylmalonate-semialdehyde dehydrogenase
MNHKFTAESYDFVEFPTVRNWVGGQWVDASGSEVFEVINPRHGGVMSSCKSSTKKDVAEAVASAKVNLKEWQSRPTRERAEVFYNLRQLMHDNLEELTWLVSHENGKTYGESKAEVLKAIECVEFGCSLPNLAAGQQLDVSRGVNCRVVYESVGIVAGITPFNFPLMVPLWMLPQALVGGNAFILKPSEQVPLSVVRLAELLQEAGVPDGIFNVVNGGKETVEALCDNEDIEALAFVGSTRVAKLVYGRAAMTGKRVLCLGGAKNHLIVVPDANLELTSQNVLASFTGCAGQRCMAASVLVAVGDVDNIISEVCRQAKEMQLGADMGAITNSSSVTRIKRYIDQAEESGASILLDGRSQAATDNGYWVGPTIIDNVKVGAPEACEEIFGPVLSIIRVNNLDEAIALENSSPYGNASAIYTSSGDVANRVMKEVSAGMCGVNIGVPVPREPFGFGGWNDSKFGHGNITGWDGYRFWTRPRKITNKWALQKDTTWMS